MDEDSEILSAAVAWRRAGRDVAIATVVTTWGSAPRPVGSQMAIAAGGDFIGSVSGGCVEAAVIEQALAVMTARAPRVLQYGVSNARAWDVGLPCGGQIEICVEPVGSNLQRLEELLAMRAAGDSAVVVTDLDSGRQGLLSAVGESGDLLPLDTAARDAAAAALAAGRSQLYAAAARRLFMRVYEPPPRLLMIGAVHVAVPLSQIAAVCGYAVTVIDPRTAFAGRAIFDGCNVVNDWPDVALPALRPDARTAIVTLTHDPKLDDLALRVALATPAFYIGALGSRRNHQARMARLASAGVAEGALARIHGPVGLDIGALSPAEIAIAIVAEMTDARRRGHRHRQASPAGLAGG